MAEFIKREAVIDLITRRYENPEICTQEINSIPAADVAPVVHSHWEHKIRDDGENIGICHNCKYPVDWFWGQAKYCPNCGAKMDGGNENV